MIRFEYTITTDYIRNNLVSSSGNGRILRLIDEQTTCHIWRANDLILMEKYQNTQIPIDIDTSSEIQIIYAYTHFDH